MKGIQFVVDEKGEKTAVLIDLQEHGELWEDFYDCLIAQARAVNHVNPLQRYASRPGNKANDMDGHFLSLTCVARRALQAFSSGGFPMSSQPAVTFQDALDIIESLPEHQQDELLRIIQCRRLERRRELLAESIKAARAEYARGEVKQGTVDELMREITE
jgi:hypothetical protein